MIPTTQTPNSASKYMLKVNEVDIMYKLLILTHSVDQSL